MPLKLGKIHQGDCLQLAAKIDDGAVDLAFADPPFNIGYKYDKYHDRQDDQDYLDWCQAWIGEIHRILKPTGTFWLAIGDEYAAELKWLATRTLRDKFDRPNFIMRSWVIWYYTFGVNCTRKFNRSHAHLFQFIKDEKEFTFNAEDPLVRVPSARAMVYGDHRANPTGRLPDDTWVLRPQDLPEAWQPMDDVQYYSRVAGTFGERRGFHGCQMPEQLLGRIIRVSSSEGDTVFDPFAGSGTTLAVAKKLNRQYLGTELSEDYVKYATERLKSIRIGDPLDGPADPASSSPNTANGVRLVDGKRTKAESIAITPAPEVIPQTAELELSDTGVASKDLKLQIVEAFARTNHGFSVDRMLADPELGDEFVAKCKEMGLPGSELDWKWALVRHRKSGQMKSVVTAKTPRVYWDDLDYCRFAGEIAWQQLRIDIDNPSLDLDEIFCDPAKAREFDRIARRFAQGHRSFEYRWAAYMLRKKKSEDFVKAARSLPEELSRRREPKSRELQNILPDRLHEVPGIYVLKGPDHSRLYVGETPNLGLRIAVHAATSSAFGGIAEISVMQTEGLPPKIRGGKQEQIIEKCHPRLNVMGRLLSA